MLWYFGNIFGMLGVAVVATAFFRNDWKMGMMAGTLFIIFVAWFHGLSLPLPKNRRQK